MLLKQGRVWATDVEAALEIIFSKHGAGQVNIYFAPVQPRTSEGLYWYEYSVEIEGG